MAKVGVIGAGSWGTALSKLLSTNGHEVTLWSFKEEEVRLLRRERENSSKLPGVRLPENIEFTADLEACIKGTDGISGSVLRYEKHSPQNGAVCGTGPDMGQRVKGN